MLRTLAFAFAVTAAAAAGAQSPVYRTDSPSGPVYSDQPAPGAQPVEVKPNVIEMAPAAPPPAVAAPATPAAPGYQSVAVASPANGDTIHTNTGAFTLQVQLSPELRAAEGDRIRVRLDGKMLPGSYSSTAIDITEEDWQGAANPEDVAHTLQVTVVDGSGKTIVESAVSSFFAHRATVRRRAR